MKCQTNPRKRPRGGSNVFEMMKSFPSVSETFVIHPTIGAFDILFLSQYHMIVVQEITQMFLIGSRMVYNTLWFSLHQFIYCPPKNISGYKMHVAHFSESTVF